MDQYRLFIFAILHYYGIYKFNPRFYAAKRGLIKEEKKLPPRHWQILERTRMAKISMEWLQIISADSITRVHWNIVDSIAVQPDYIFLFIGPVIIIPRRDFPTEENYQEFGKTLMEYWESRKNKPISADLISKSK